MQSTFFHTIRYGNRTHLLDQEKIVPFLSPGLRMEGRQASNALRTSLAVCLGIALGSVFIQWQMLGKLNSQDRKVIKSEALEWHNGSSVYSIQANRVIHGICTWVAGSKLWINASHSPHWWNTQGKLRKYSSDWWWPFLWSVLTNRGRCIRRAATRFPLDGLLLCREKDNPCQLL